MTKIEEMTMAHVAAYHMLLTDVASECKYLGILEPPSLQATMERIDYCISHCHPMFVMRRDNDLVGWCGIHIVAEPGFQHVGQLFMGVHGSCRGQGIGKALLACAIAKAWTEKLHRIELDVCIKNRPAVCLYRSVGFVEEGVRRSAYLLNGNYEDVTMMSLLHAERAPVKRSVRPLELISWAHRVMKGRFAGRERCDRTA